MIFYLVFIIFYLQSFIENHCLKIYPSAVEGTFAVLYVIVIVISAPSIA